MGWMVGIKVGDEYLGLGCFFVSCLSLPRNIGRALLFFLAMDNDGD